MPSYRDNIHVGPDKILNLLLSNPIIIPNTKGDGGEGVVPGLEPRTYHILGK